MCSSFGAWAGTARHTSETGALAGRGPLSGGVVSKQQSKEEEGGNHACGWDDCGEKWSSSRRLTEFYYWTSIRRQ